MEYPVTTEIPLTDPHYNRTLAGFYETCTQSLRDLAAGGADVVVLCEGDPFFYGSFMHLYMRLADQVPVEVVPAITGMSAAWTATGAPITWGDDVLTVLMGTLQEDDLARRMAQTDALVVMKIGRNIDKVRRALQASGRYGEAWLVEYAAMPGQTVARLAEVGAEVTALFLDHPRARAGAAAMSGSLVIAGLGPGAERLVTAEVRDALASGLGRGRLYPLRGAHRGAAGADAARLRQPGRDRPGAPRPADGLRGGDVVVVSSGDPGVFAMAAAVFEAVEHGPPHWRDLDIRVLPGHHRHAGRVGTRGRAARP